MLNDPTFWVAVAFFIFIGILVYTGVPGKMVAALDARSAEIAKELDEARALRDEAHDILEQYKAKAAAAEQEAQSIIDDARTQAERMAADAQTRTEDFINRRTRMAELKIAQAEAQAMADVRAAAAEASVNAAEKLLSTTVKGKVADELFKSGLSEIKSLLN